MKGASNYRIVGRGNNKLRRKSWRGRDITEEWGFGVCGGSGFKLTHVVGS